MAKINAKIADLFRSGGLFLISGFYAQFIAFCGHTIIVRMLPPSRYGDIALALSIVTIVPPIAILGIGEGLPRLIAGSDSEEHTKYLISSGISLILAISIIVATSLYILTPIIAEFFGNFALHRLLPIFTLQVVFTITSTAFVGILRGYQLSRALSISRDIIPKSIGLSILGIFIWLVGPLQAAIVYYVAVPTITTVAVLYSLLKLGKLPIVKPSAKHTSDLLSYSWPLALSSSLVMLMVNSDILFLGYYMSSETIGYYRSVKPLGQLILMGLTATVTIYLPLATQFYEEENYNDIGHAFTVTAKWLSLLTFPIVGVFVFFSDDVVVAFFGSSYEQASIVLSILTVGMYSRVLSGPNGATAQAINRPKTELYAGALGFIVNLIFNIILIPPLGLAGAALATAFAFISYNIFEIYIIYQDIGSHPFSVDTFKPMLPSIATGVFLYILLPDRVSLAILLFTGFIWTLFQLVFIPLTNSFTSTDKDILLQMNIPLAKQMVSVMERLQRL